MKVSASRLQRGRGMRVALVLGLTVPTCFLVLAPVAEAQTSQDPVSGVIVHTEGGPAAQSVSIQDLYPGTQHESVFFFDGDGSAHIETIALDVTNVRDFENGCNRPEQHTPDLSCGQGDDQGELSGFLELELSWGVEQASGDGLRSCLVEAAPVDAHLLSETTRLIVERSSTALSGDVMCLSATFHHVVKGASDNLTQTDSVLFDLELQFEGDDPRGVAPAETEVRGVTIDRGRIVVPSAVVPAGRTLSVGLAATGRPLALLLGAGLLLMGTGVLAVQALARRESA